MDDLVFGKKNFLVEHYPISMYGAFIPARTIINNAKNIINLIEWPELSCVDVSKMNETECEGLALQCIIKICDQEKIDRTRFSLIQSNTLSDEYSFMCSILIGVDYILMANDTNFINIKKEIFTFIKTTGIVKEFFEDMNEDDEDNILTEHVSDIVFEKCVREDENDLDDFDRYYEMGLKDGGTTQYYKVLSCLFKLHSKGKLKHDFDDLNDEIQMYVYGMDTSDFKKWLTNYLEYKKTKK